MTITTSLRSRLFLALGFALGCGEETPSFPDAGPVDMGDGVVDECSEASPCALQLGERGQAFIADVGDEDPWVFDVPTAGRVIDLRITNDATFSPVQIEAALFGPGGAAITNQRSPSSRGRQRVEIRLIAEQAGLHRLVIRDVGGDGADRRNPYFVEVSLLADGDANEPNDTAAEAAPLGLGVVASGAIATQGDLDWFSVELSAGQRVEIRASAPGVGTVRHRWSLFAPDGSTRIAESTEPSADTPWAAEVRAVGAQGGRFLILVEDDATDGIQGDPQRLYTLTVNQLPEPDAQEGLVGNETPMTATPVSAGQAVTAYVASTADADWYAIQVDSASPQAPQIVTARVSYPAATEVELQLAMYEGDGTTPICERRDGDACRYLRIVRDATEGPSSLETAHFVTAPGTYLVAVRDLQGDELDDDTPYTLTVGLPADPDLRENYRGDGRSAAIPIAPATSTTGATITYEWVEGSLSYANDTDWYRFDIPGAEGASPGQNGDWLVAVQIQMPSPTPVELNAFFYGPDNSSRERYRGLGQRCRDPSPDDPDFCQWPDNQNGLDVDFSTTLGSSSGECFVVFREVTGVGPHYWRMSDLDRDDFDLGPTGRYRLRMSITAGCPGDSACAGRFLQNGSDLCGRP